MKKITILLAILIIPFITFSQVTKKSEEVTKSEIKKFEYTPKVKNRVEVKNLLGKISIKNASGNSIIIESDFNIDKPERADGLKLLGIAEDNTELGINIGEENGIVSISGVTNQVKDYKYTISIPEGIAVSIDYSSPFASGDVEINGYKGSLEMKTLNAKIKLTECTGPLAVNSISGDIEVVFSSINQDEPTSLASISGFVDVTIPSSSTTSFEISNVTGNIYNNLDLKSDNPETKDDRAYGMESIKKSKGNKFTMNGGGQKMLLKSISGNIYIRKK